MAVQRFGSGGSGGARGILARHYVQAPGQRQQQDHAHGYARKEFNILGFAVLATGILAALLARLVRALIY